MKKSYLNVLAALAIGFSISVSAQTTVTYNYTGAVQTFTVPACVSSITVDVLGAKAGNNGSYTGGMGGRVQATVPVTAGEVLNLYVGQLGVNTSQNNPAVFNGGGGVYSYTSGGTAGTGGGASDIRRTPYSTSDRLVVAGGGGGGGYINIGGNGGGLIGQDGVPYPSWPNSGGKGGTQSAGGAAGVACCSCPTYTTAGAFFQGGNGAGDGAGGGGGGGGYYGGGGSCFAGGGGGSSYTAPGVTAVTHTQGYNSAAGQIVITYTVSGGAPASPASIAGSSSVCSGTSASFSISPVLGATSYTWTVPPGSVINSGQGTTTINVTFGTTSGNITVTADNSCGSSSPTNFPLAVTLTPNLSIIATNGVICIGNNTTLIASGGSTYNWMPGNLSGSTVNVSPSATTTYTVIASNGVCTDTDVITVSVNALPVVALGNDTALCSGTITLDAGNAGSTYLWNDNSSAQTLIANTSGTYSVVVTDGNGCTGNDAIDVTINSLPVVSLGNSITQCGGTVTLDAGNAGSTYLWNDNSTAQTLIANASGTYSVVVTDGNGCTGNDAIDVTINPLPTVTYVETQTLVCINWNAITLTAGSPATGTYTGPGVSGNQFDPVVAGAGTHIIVYTYTDGNGCTSSDTSLVIVDLCTGINAISPGGISIYPNPNSGTFTVTTDADSQLEIVNTLGEIVFSKKINAGTNSVSTGNLAHGVYTVRLISNDGKVRQMKMVMEK